MIHSGENVLDGVPVTVIRKRIRRINIRIGADGRVYLSIPQWWATLHEGEAFLRAKWKWVTKTRAEMLAKPVRTRTPPTESELEDLKRLLQELHASWCVRLGEAPVTWKIRRAKSVWGCCHWRERHVNYNAELAHAPRELVEYVVVHELTHLVAHDHGERFYALMDERLPDWKAKRRRLNKREWGKLVQAEFW